MPKPDWATIEQEYITGGDDVTCKHVAEKHQVPGGTVRRRSQQGRWMKKREKFRALASERALEKGAENRAEVLAAQNAELAELALQNALVHGELALGEEKPSGAYSRMLACAIGIDKWRLLTNQTTDRQQVDRGDVTGDILGNGRMKERFQRLESVLEALRAPGFDGKDDRDEKKSEGSDD